MKRELRMENSIFPVFFFIDIKFFNGRHYSVSTPKIILNCQQIRRMLKAISFDVEKMKDLQVGRRRMTG